MDFSQYLRDRVHRIDSALDGLFAPGAHDGVPAGLAEALRYSLLNGGKRIRPVLCMAACEAVGGHAESALEPALAVEILHTYTLVHDDLPCMDDDALRRGQPTVHVKYGEGAAVLVGDALQALAFDVLGRSLFDVERLRAGWMALCRAAGPGGVVGGQWEDVTAAPPHTPERIGYVHQHKTADLLSCAARLGAIAGNGDAVQIAALADYGKHLGLAFQIIDDLLDEPERRVANDPELSCLDVWTEEEARAEAERHSRSARQVLEDLPGPTEPLRTLLSHLLERRF